MAKISIENKYLLLKNCVLLAWFCSGFYYKQCSLLLDARCVEKIQPSTSVPSVPYELVPYLVWSTTKLKETVMAFGTRQSLLRCRSLPILIYLVVSMTDAISFIGRLWKIVYILVTGSFLQNVRTVFQEIFIAQQHTFYVVAELI